uniref:hypothetical protein n=1 Tax=Salegentibacter sediminis TaxID=1930251 RepID=UPI00373FDFE5
MTIHTPPHGKRCILINHLHLLDWTMTCLTLHPTHTYMLRVVKVSKVWKIMNSHPLNWLSFSGIRLCRRIPANGIVQFCNLAIIKIFRMFCSCSFGSNFRNSLMAIHTNI